MACLDVGPGARQPRLGLGHVGAGHLADLEAVAGRLQLPLQPLLVVEGEIEHDLVAEGRGVGVDGVQQHLLLQREQPGALGADQVLGPAHLRLGAAAGVEVLAQGQADRLVVRFWSKSRRLAGVAPRRPLDAAVEEQARPIAGQRLRHQLVDLAQLRTARLQRGLVR